MKRLPPLPEIPATERTPLVVALVDLIGELRETVQWQDEEIGLLKDEIAMLKGEKARPQFKPSRMEPKADQGEEEPAEGEARKKRPGSEKRSKTAALTIHREVKCPPKAIPAGSRFKGYEPYVVQELVVTRPTPT